MNKSPTGLARAFFDAGDFAESVAVATDPAEALLFRVCAFSEAGRYAESLELLKEFKAYYDSVSPRFKSSFHHQRALGYANTGRADEAFLEYEAARDWAREAGDDMRQARAQNNLARLHKDAGQFEKAIEEVDGAIRMARTDQGLLGRFLDHKAQILLAGNQLSEAVNAGRNAVEILEQHGNEVSLSEARLTYGKALVTYGASQLDQLEPVTKYTERKKVNLTVSLDAEIVQLALDRTGGRVYRAANLIGEKHPTLIKLIEERKLHRIPKRRRAKSLIKK